MALLEQLFDEARGLAGPLPPHDLLVAVNDRTKIEVFKLNLARHRRIIVRMRSDRQRTPPEYGGDADREGRRPA